MTHKKPKKEVCWESPDPILAALAAGLGPTGRTSGLNQELLAHAFEAVNSAFEKRGLSLGPKKNIRLCADVMDTVYEATAILLAGSPSPKLENLRAVIASAVAFLLGPEPPSKPSSRITKDEG